MADQLEKMEALKKVYAEIILNTAKEAADRALKSERKAVHIHHDLRNTKDEAIRLLVRFKRMIDVKTNEAETTALSQQNRIKELDAQLNETEGVIIDLREEIRNACERLEEMKNIHNLQSNADPNVTEHFRCSSQCSKSCNPNEITTSGPNSASIISGNKKPESYRNGCTHRIRAIEMNLVGAKGITEEKKSIINVDEKFSGKCVQFSVDTENKDIKNINGSEAFSINSRLSKDQTVKTQRFPNSVRYAQSNHKLSRVFHENLNVKEKASGNDEKLPENDENIACILRRSIRKRRVRCWDDLSSSFKSRASLSHFKKHHVSDGVKFEETEGTKLLNHSVVKKHKSDAKESDGIACNTDNNSCLKYTFSRRHKKVLSSKSDNNCSHGKSFLTGQLREKPSFNHENKKHNLIEDSSSDSQNMIDIAYQLISLSGERSW